MSRFDERFEAIYRRNFARVYRYIRSCGIADDEAQDLAQGVFLRLFEAMDRYRGDAEWAFLRKAADHAVSNWVRARKTAKRTAKLVPLDDPEFNEEPVAPEEPDYAERDQEARRSRRLHEVMRELSNGQRECLKLWLDGLQYNEIASVLRTTVDGVKSRLRDAKRILAEKLPEEHK